MSALENRRVSEGAGRAPGRRLAEARQAQNQTAAEVARHLKLSLSQVEALESGRYEQLPGPIFVRGFIRNYARLVRLDPNELLNEAGDTVPQTVPPPDRPKPKDIPFPGQRKRYWPLTAALLLIVGVLVIYEFYWENLVPGEAPPAAALTPFAQPAAVVRVPDQTDPVSAPGPAAADDAEPELRGAAEPAGQTAQEAAPMVAAAMEEPEVAPAAGQKRVTLEFEEESWVEIRDRNERVVFSRLNSPGTQRQVDGVPPLSVVVGNAHAVRLSYDGKTVDLGPHTRIDVARLTLR
jgi:cytoskeleton protein RodZ